MTTTSNLTQTDSTPDDILHPDSRKLFRYWESIRREKSAPDKSDFDLKQIANLLPFMGVLQRHPLKQVYNWRLAGTGICRMFTANLTNTQFVHDWQPFESSVISRMLDTAVSSHQPCVARIKASNSQGDTIGLELLVLPVATSSPAITHLYVGLVPFRQPAWLGKDALTYFELSKVRMIWTEHGAEHRNSNAQTAIALAPADQMNRPFFRVIQGGLSE